MSYLESLLATDETLQLVRRRHWVAVLRALVLNGLAIGILALATGVTTGLGVSGRDTLWSVVSLVLGALMVAFVVRLVLEIVRYAATVYAVTTRRVIEVSGVFNKVARDSNLDKINDLVLYQSALGRLLNYGDIDIITGSDTGVNRLDRIKDPVGFKRVMLDNKEDLDTLIRRTLNAGG